MNTSSTFRSWIYVSIIVVVIIISAALWWKQREDFSRISKENEQLRQQLISSVSDEPGGTNIGVTTESGQPIPLEENIKQKKEAEELVATPSGMAPPPRDNGLVLSETIPLAVEGGGMGATLHFTSATSDPLGVVAVVVRLPRNSDSRIQSLELLSSSGFTDITTRISDDGKFAIYNATVSRAEFLDVVLKVSSPVIADVRGTTGIGPLDLDLSELGVVSRLKQ